MLSIAIAKFKYKRLLSLAVLAWLVLASPLVSFATSFIDVSPRCCRDHYRGGMAGLFAKHSCCCRKAASRSSAPAMHSRSECGSACGCALNAIVSPVYPSFAAGSALSVALPTASQIIVSKWWSAPEAQILALRRYQRPPPAFS